MHLQLMLLVFCGKIKISCFSSIQLKRSMELYIGGSFVSMMGGSSLVPSDGCPASGFPDTPASKDFDFFIQEKAISSILPKNDETCISAIKERRRHADLSPEIKSVIKEFWQPSIRMKYESAIRRWNEFAKSRNVDPYITDVNSVVTLLHVP